MKNSCSCRPAAAGRAEQDAVVRDGAPAAQPPAAAGDEQEAAGEGANRQGSEGAGQPGSSERFCRGRK